MSQGGSSAKGGSSNRQKETIVKNKKLETSALNANVLVLRNALFEESGADKDVTASIASIFKTFKRNGMNVRLDFSVKLTKKEFTWAYELTKGAMEQVYDDSGYGWDDEDKEKELKEDGARFLIVRDEASNEPVAFCHFRFTVQGEVMQQMTGTTCLYVWDIQVEEEFQRKGLGGHLLKVLELIAFQQRMKFVSVPVQVACTSGISFITKVKGYGPDAYLSEMLQFSAEDEGFQVYSKELGTGKTKAVAASAVPATAAVADVAPAPAPVAAKKVDNNVFGFGAAAATTPLKTKTPMMESSPTSIAVADEGADLGDAMDRLAVN